MSLTVVTTVLVSEEIKKVKQEVGEEVMDKITDLLGANQELHLDRLFDKAEVPTVRIRRKEVKPASVEEVVEDGEVFEEEKEKQAEGADKDEKQAAGKEMPAEFYAQRSISGARPIPVPCNYRLCVANHNTRHTADR